MKNEKIFDRIAGYKKEKEELIRLCEVIRNREEYRKKGARPPKGIIQNNSNAVALLAKALIEKTYLSKSECEALLQDC